MDRGGACQQEIKCKAEPIPTQFRKEGGELMIRDLPSIEKVGAYVEKMPGAISGAGGHDQTFAVACKIVKFGLSPDEAWPLLVEYNQRCQPDSNPDVLRRMPTPPQETNLAFPNPSAAPSRCRLFHGL